MSTSYDSLRGELRARHERRAFTLIEVLVSTALTLLLMAAVAQLFAYVTNGIFERRAYVETGDRLREIRQLLQQDLKGITAPTTPPLNPDFGQGYFEYIEGPIGPIYTLSDLHRAPSPNTAAITNSATSPGGFDDTADETLGDIDDILMFTARSVDGYFRGRWNVAPGGSANEAAPHAEICWFLRGTQLYRRQLMVFQPGSEVPDGSSNATASSANYTDRKFYQNNDVSMRMVGGEWAPDAHTYVGAGSGPSFRRVVITNSLGDLTKRENRYGHQPLVYPYDARFWNRAVNAGNGQPEPAMGLPNARESTCPLWFFPFYEQVTGHTGGYGTAWTYPWADYFPIPGGSGSNLNIPFPITSAYPNLMYIFPKGQSLAFGNQVIAGNNIAPHLAFGSKFNANFGGALANYLGPIGGITRNGSVRLPQTIGINGGMIDIRTNGNSPTVASGPDTYLVQMTPASGTGPGGVSLGNSYGSARYYDGGVSDDLVLTNVIGFDVKAWDPGAPIFDCIACDNAGNPTGLTVAVGPGDRGYGAVLTTFVNAFFSGGSTMPPNIAGISFGAYVDLNAMWSAGTPVSPAPAYLTGQARYKTALANYELKKLGAAAANTLPRPRFCDGGDARSGLAGLNYPANGNPGRATPDAIASTYCTWSTHYESDGLDNNGDGLVDPLFNGLDDSINPATGLYSSGNITGGIDDATEAEAPPPYPFPLRGIQIKIRVFEPDSRQIREVTLAHQLIQ